MKDKVKRRIIASQLEKYDIMFLQETHSTEAGSKQWHKDFQASKGFWDHGESNARGAGILINKNSEIEEIWNDEKNQEGRIKAIVVKWKKQNIGLISVYAPNISWGKKSEVEYIAFTEKLEKSIQEIKNKSDQIVLGGDLNLVQSKWDLQGGVGVLNKKCIEAIQKCMGKNKLVDIYREKNKRITITTYVQYGISKEEKRRRLDYVYVSERIKDATKVISNKTITNTDHNLVMIQINYNDFKKKNNGLWRHNNLLNTDASFIEGLKEMIRSLDYESLTSKQAMWEFTKYKIGQYSRDYSKRKAKERKEKEGKILRELEEATDRFGNRKEGVSEKKFKELKQEAQLKLEKEEKATIFRANVKYYEEGEKCTSYFFRQIKTNRKASNINTLKRSDGTVLKGNEVNNEIYNYYETLYKNYDSEEMEYKKVKNKFLGSNLEAKVTKESSRELEKELTKSELRKALFGSMKEGKAPGNDGLTSGLYRAIWHEVEGLFFDATKEALEKGTLAPTQRQSIIRLIEKKGKNSEEIRNWRPISLINVDTKIIAKAIANRLKKTVQDIIGKEQTGFLKNRYIGEGIRLTEYLIERYKRKNKEGYIVAIDFQKAFDSCSHRYLYDVLQEYGFGKNFINMIKMLYNGAESAVLNEGLSTRYFKVNRSCRQGDPLSPYLFIIMIEPLISKLRRNRKISGMKTGKREVKAAAFADDLTAFLADRESVRRMLETLEEFKILSGLNVNKDKTELMAMKREDNKEWAKEMGIKQVEFLNITGVYQGLNKEATEELNWGRIVEKTKAMLNRWKGRDLSLLGRVMIVKAQGISQIQYLASNITMPQRYIKQINKLIYNFIWKGPDKIKRTIIRRKIIEGGLAVPDAMDIAKAASIQWIGRGERWAEAYWNDFWQEDLEKIGGRSSLNSKPYKEILDKKNCYSFNEYILKSWWEQVRPPEKEFPELLLGVNIWTDTRLAKPKYDDLRKKFLKKGLSQVKDFLDSRGNIRKKPEIEHSDINILLWARAINRIPKEWTSEIQKWKRVEEREEEETERGRSIIKIRTRKGIISAEQITQRIIKENIVDQLKREETKYRDNLSIEFGTTAMEWKKVDRRVMTHSISTKNRSFMYRFNNGITYNNTDFHRFGYKESDKCSFCKQEKQSSKHLFWECAVIRNL